MNICLQCQGCCHIFVLRHVCACLFALDSKNFSISRFRLLDSSNYIVNFDLFSLCFGKKKDGSII